MTRARLDAIRKACELADWEQVRLNGGPICYHLEDGSFCLRTERWVGHSALGTHKFTTLSAVMNEALDFVDNELLPVVSFALALYPVSSLLELVGAAKRIIENLQEDKQWPDWKLDSHTLAVRDERRKNGEILPKPSKKDLEINQLRAANEELTKERDAARTECERLTRAIDQIKDAREKEWNQRYEVWNLPIEARKQPPGTPEGMRVKRLGGRIIGPGVWENAYTCEVEPIPSSPESAAPKENQQCE